MNKTEIEPLMFIFLNIWATDDKQTKNLFKEKHFPIMNSFRVAQFWNNKMFIFTLNLFLKL